MKTKRTENSAYWMERIVEEIEKDSSENYAKSKQQDDFMDIQESIKEILERTQTSHLVYLCKLCNEVKYIGILLPENLKILIKEFIKRESQICGIWMIPFIDEALEISCNNFLKMRDIIKTVFLKTINDLHLENSPKFKSLIENILNDFLQSGSFNTADYYAETIMLVLDFLTEDNIKFILEKSLQNMSSYGNSNQVRTQDKFFISLCLYSQEKFPSLQPHWLNFIEASPSKGLYLEELDKLKWIVAGNNPEDYVRKALDKEKEVEDDDNI